MPDAVQQTTDGEIEAIVGPVMRQVSQLLIEQLQGERERLRVERDDYRDLWLKQVDVNDRLRARLAADAATMERLEAMHRE